MDRFFYQNKATSGIQICLCDGWNTTDGIFPLAISMTEFHSIKKKFLLLYAESFYYIHTVCTKSVAFDMKILAIQGTTEQFSVHNAVKSVHLKDLVHPIASEKIIGPSISCYPNIIL